VIVVAEQMARHHFATPLQAALVYARDYGWSVIPMGGDKKPLVGWKRYQTEIADEQTIRGWYRDNPTAGVGVVTGRVSGLWVVDWDTPEGRQALASLNLPVVPTVTTKKGEHRYFALPKEMRNTARHVPGLDTRGEGGYVVAPPSLHPSGQRYAWAVSPLDAMVTEPPDSLVDLFDNEDAAIAGGGAQVAGDSDGFLDVLQGGVGAGGRNDAASRLAGHYLARGLPEEEVAEILGMWNAVRCTPPLPQQELRATVKSIAQAEARKQGAVTLTMMPPWPVLEPDALYGLAGDIVRAIEPHSEADPAAILVNALVMFGNAANRAPHALVDGKRQGLNLFAAIVGDTASGRKGSSMGRLNQLFHNVDPTWSSDHVLSGLSSGEGVISAVKDGDEDDAAVDPVRRDKRVLVVEEEFANVMKVARREGNIVTGIIRQAWDGGNLHLMTKNPVKAKDPHISILAHVTTQELRKLMSDTDTSNGFANRFLWVCSKRSKYLPDGGGIIHWGHLSAQLIDALAFAEANTAPYVRDEAAREIWADVYRTLSDRPMGILGAVTGRAAAQVLRLSTVYAALDRSPKIGEPHLMAALALWTYCEQSARYIFGDATGDPVCDAILAALATAGEEGLDMTAIADIFGRHKAPQRALALQQLEDSGRIAHKAEKTGGRARIVYTIAS